MDQKINCVGYTFWHVKKFCKHVLLTRICYQGIKTYRKGVSIVDCCSNSSCNFHWKTCFNSPSRRVFCYFEGEFLNTFRLSCPGNQFVLKHLQTLNNGSNLFAVKLKHFNHQPELHSHSEGWNCWRKCNKDSYPKPPPKRNHLIDDTDLSYKKWGGLKNK